MLFDLNNPSFQTQISGAIRLEDLKNKTKETIQQLCTFLNIEEQSSLYKATMQGHKWWGDPSSSLYGQNHDIDNNKGWDNDPINMSAGALFSESDQFVLNTLFFPLSNYFTLLWT